MTLKTYLAFGQKKITEAKLHFSDSYQHMEQLVLRVLNYSSSDLLLKKEELLTETQLNQLNQVLERRLLGEPLQYILGYEYFYESKFFVGIGCLIPRRETELIVDELLDWQKKSPLKVAELGAGTGNIGISVVLKRPEIEWLAYEINAKSISYAKKNIDYLLTGRHRYTLCEDDFFTGALKQAPYDVVVSNPPYVSHQELKEIPKEVSYEPILALDGGEKGLDVINKLLASLPVLLKPGGLFLCEISSSQEVLLRALLNGMGLRNFEILRDLSSLPRLLKLGSPTNN